jgi:4'-phosphopantetheinyl transferase
VDAGGPLSFTADSTPQAVLWVARVSSHARLDPVASVEYLDDAERETARRFRVRDRQRRFVLGRVLLRRILADVLAVGPADVDIELGHNNRPQLSASMAAEARRRFGLPLDFNLSSTEGRIALGLALGARIGVDVEAPRPLDDLHELARTVLGTEEIAWMDAQREPLHAFYRLWTLKEAAAKAHGEGLGLPFQELRIQPDETGGLLADFTVLDSQADPWSVLSLEAAGPAALAVHWKDGTPGAIDLDPPWPTGCELQAAPVETTARL